MLVFRCGSGCNEVTDELLKVSAILELVHVATLVHDDVLDEARFEGPMLRFTLKSVKTMQFFLAMLCSVLLWN